MHTLWLIVLVVTCACLGALGFRHILIGWRLGQLYYGMTGRRKAQQILTALTLVWASLTLAAGIALGRRLISGHIRGWYIVLGLVVLSGAHVVWTMHRAIRRIAAHTEGQRLPGELWLGALLLKLARVVGQQDRRRMQRFLKALMWLTVFLTLALSGLIFVWLCRR